MFKHFSSQHKAILFALAGFSSFSFADAGAKWISQDLSIYHTVAMIQLSAAALMICFSQKLGGIHSLWDNNAKKYAKIHALRSILNALINILIVYAFTKLPLASVYTAIFTKPYIAAILAVFLFGQTIGLHRAIAITIGFVGVLIAFQPWSQTFPLETGIILIFLPFIIAIMFMAAKWVKEGSLLAIGFWPVFTSGIINVGLAYYAGDHHLGFISPLEIIIILCSGACVLSGITCVSIAFQTGDSAAVSPMVYIEMIWGVLLGYLVFGDIPQNNMIIGSFIIITSGIYLIYRENKSHQ